MARPQSAQIPLSAADIIRVILFLFTATSASMALEQPPQDALRLQVADSLRPTLRKQPFMPEVGAVSQPVDSMRSLHRNLFQHTDVTYVGDLLRKIPGVFIRDFGEPGQAEQLSIAGVGISGIALLLDGRPLNDPIQRGYNLYDVPMEYVSALERVDGPRALLFGGTSPGGVLNVVSEQYNSNRPRTKLRFFQGAFEHILTDGMFSQNISRGLNALVGIQRHVTDGRFTNAGYDSWNVRVRFRYDPTEQLSAWVSEVYSKSSLSLNSGVDPVASPSIYDDVTAVVRDGYSYQIAARHDLTLGIVGTFLNDSTQRTKALLYYSALDREYSIGSDAGAPPVFSDFQESSYWGSRIEQNLNWSFATILAGAQFESRSIYQSHFLPSQTEQYTSVMAGVTLVPVDWARGEITVRQEKLRDISATEWGTDVEFDIAPGLSLSGSHGISRRFPTIQDLFWTDSVLTRTGNLTEERHRLTEVGLKARSGDAELSVIGFRRLVENALIYTQTAPVGSARSVTVSNISSVEISGAMAEIRLRLWKVQAEGNLTYASYKAQGRSSLQMPRLTSTGEFSFRDLLFGGNLDLKLAIRWKTISNHLGLQFIPRMLVTVQQSKIEMPAFGTLDLYSVAKIGNAYVALTWENPLNTTMMVLPYYPLMNRNIKLGVNWEFTD